MTPIVRNVQNNDCYEYLGEGRFKNLRTGQEGVVADDVAQRVFKINVEASLIFHEYPLVKELVTGMKLKFDNNKK